MSDEAVVNLKEEWRTLPQDENVKVSSFGRVKRRGKIVHPKPDFEGYLRLKVKGKQYRLHRLIAEMFIPNPNNYPVIDHIDNNHSNNRIDNLRWCTIQQNSQFAAAMNLVKSRPRGDSVILCIDKENKGYLFSTSTDMAKKFDLDGAQISDLFVGKRKTIKGYKAIRVDHLEDLRRCES